MVITRQDWIDFQVVDVPQREHRRCLVCCAWMAGPTLRVSPSDSIPFWVCAPCCAALTAGMTTMLTYAEGAAP